MSIGLSCVLTPEKSAKAGGTIRSESAGSPRCGSFLEAQFIQGVLATSFEATPRPHRHLCPWRRATTVSWDCQVRSAAGSRGLVYITPAAEEEETAVIGGRSWPGPAVVAGSARAAAA